MGKDPAFLFYPGDAAEDVSHMNRLERGAYFDIVQAQKKFGPMALSTVQKILGKDFDACWDSLKMCLTYEQHMYFIPWLQESIEKRKKYSVSRSKNRKGQIQPETKENETTYVQHMEIENGNSIVLNKQSVQNEIFADEQFITELTMLHPGKDLKDAFGQCWTYHSQKPSKPTRVWEWRQKLSTWLISYKAGNGSVVKKNPGKLA